MPVTVQQHVRRRPRREGRRTLYIPARNAGTAKRFAQRTWGGHVVLSVELADAEKIRGQKDYKVTIAYRLRRRKSK